MESYFILSGSLCIMFTICKKASNCIPLIRHQWDVLPFLHYSCETSIKATTPSSPAPLWAFAGLAVPLNYCDILFLFFLLILFWSIFIFWLMTLLLAITKISWQVSAVLQFTEQETVDRKSILMNQAFLCTISPFLVQFLVRTETYTVRASQLWIYLEVILKQIVSTKLMYSRSEGEFKMERENCLPHQQHMRTLHQGMPLICSCFTSVSITALIGLLRFLH